MHRLITQHQQTTHLQGVVQRDPSPVFCPPIPAHMPEPGMNYITIITAEGTQRIQVA